MSISFQDYFCQCCGSLLHLSNSLAFSSKRSGSSNVYGGAVHLVCHFCKTRSYKGTTPHGFVPLRQILKAEIIKDSDMWANASSTEEKCPKCSHGKAYYLQMQTRSADEPMTTYYRCQKCSHNWKD